MQRKLVRLVTAFKGVNAVYPLASTGEMEAMLDVMEQGRVAPARAGGSR